MMKLGRNLLTGEPLSDVTRQYRKLAAFGDGDDDNRSRPQERRGTLVEVQDGISFMNAARASIWRLRQEGEIIYSLSPPLLRVLGLFRGTDATDPRDKVIAFLNIASDTKDLGLVPDYTASAQSVYRRTTEAIMKKTKSLSVLSHVQEPGDGRLHDLPGWVPDFSVHTQSTPLDTADDDVLFCASGAGTEAWFKIHDDDTLEVETIEMDVIT